MATLDDIGEAAEVARRNRERQGPTDAFLQFLASYAPGLSIGRFVTGGVPAAIGGMEEGARQAIEEAGSLQRGGSYNAGPVTLQALGATAAPVAGPAATIGTLGAGLIRRAAPAASVLTKAERAAPFAEAKFPQYATEYPPIGPPKTKLKTDQEKYPGQTYEAKELTPEAKVFKKERQKIITEMEKEGYTPYFDPSKRFDVDPKNYPLNVDTTNVPGATVPKKPDVLMEHLDKVGAQETRDALQKYYAKGVELGGEGPRLTTQDWYMMGQLENELVRQMGAKAGREAFKQNFASAMAATTGGMDPRSNLLAAGYYNFLRSRGEPWPVTNQWPFPVGARYGEQLSDVAQKVAEGGGWQYLGPTNPKRHNFAANFMGQRTPGTMDEQMTMAMTGKGVPDWYGVNERIAAEEAAKAGVDPRKFQETVWHGFKNVPGTPMIEEINAAIERTHRLTGMPREEIVRRAWGTGDIPLYGTGAVPIPTREE